MTGPGNPSIVLNYVEMNQLRTSLSHRVAETLLLYIHMEGVEVNADIWLVYQICQCPCLLRRVNQICFVTIYRLDS